MKHLLSFLEDHPIVFALFFPFLISLFILKYLRLRKILKYFKNDFFNVKNVFFKVFLKSFIFTLFFIFTFLSLFDIVEENSIAVNDKKEFDIAFLIDVSNSMLARDVEPSRLKKGIQIIRAIMGEFKEFRFSLTAFKGQGEVLVPVTDDISRINQYIEYLEPDIFTFKGSNLELGMQKAIYSLNSSKNSNKMVVVISDGEYLSGSMTSVLKKLKLDKITVLSIGMGTENGAKIPLKDGSFLSYNGSEVVSYLKNADLVKLAKDTNGKYFDSSSLELFGNLIGYISSYKDEIKKGFITYKRSQYYIFLLLALFFLFLYSIFEVFA